MSVRAFLTALSVFVATTAGAVSGAWFQGSVEDAMAAAKAANKPLLLYWGAVWCPPCNELKQQVFSTPRFAELSKTLVAAQLDGDDENAQTWGDKLQVSGYPTLLVFDATGREVMRLSESLDMVEFEAALTSALATGGTLVDAVDAALAGRASDDQWRMLATYQWGVAAGLPYSPGRQLEIQLALAEKAPAKLPRERSLLAAAALYAASDAGDDADAGTMKALDAMKKAAATLIDAMLASDEAAWAARSTVVFAAKQIIGWAFPEPTQDSAAVEAKWLAAADRIGKDQRASVDVRLMSNMPAVELALLRKKPDAALPPALVERARAAAKRADQEAKTAYERHAAIPDAGMLLAAIGDLDGARQLLVAELAKAKTPWYYESTLSHIYGEAGKSAEALAWSAKARQSAQGRASRLQWISSDLLLVAKTPQPSQAAKLAEVAKEYYTTALALPDGFAGRNARRSSSVAGALAGWLGEPAVKQVVDEAAKACKGEACAAHFARLGRPSR